MKKVSTAIKKLVLPALIAFMMCCLIGCAQPAALKSDDSTAKTPEATAEPTQAPTLAPSAAPTETPAADIQDEGQYFSDNKYILNFLGKLVSIAPGLGLSFDTSGYFFTDNNITKTDYGRMVNVGDYYENEIVMVGTGFNMDDENMWYVSFETSKPGADEWYQKYFFATICALANNPIPYGESFDEIAAFADTMYAALVDDGKDKAIILDGYVYAYVNKSETTAIFAVDTLSYFDAYKRNSSNIQIIDLTEGAAEIAALLPNGEADPEEFILKGGQALYSYEDLNGFSKEQMGYIRNGLYALSGKIFKTPKYVEYFKSKSWYTPVTDVDATVEAAFNQYQTANLSLCVQYEKDKGWR